MLLMVCLSYFWLASLRLHTTTCSQLPPVRPVMNYVDCLATVTLILWDLRSSGIVFRHDVMCSCPAGFLQSCSVDALTSPWHLHRHLLMQCVQTEKDIVLELLK